MDRNVRTHYGEERGTTQCELFPANGFSKIPAMDDFNVEHELTIAIKRPLWKVIVSYSAAFLAAALAGGLMWNALARPYAEGAFSRTVDVAINTALFAAIAVFACLIATAFAWYPEFAVRKDGIRLPVARRPIRTSFGSFRDLGLYRWEEVAFCDWSHSQPGVLNVQLKSTRSLGKSLDDPPTRLFYRVPERHRADVEKAIRGRGKWAG
jgi:hypothetical protein